jgi:hypothetical protein
VWTEVLPQLLQVLFIRFTFFGIAKLSQYLVHSESLDVDSCFTLIAFNLLKPSGNFTYHQV